MFGMKINSFKKRCVTAVGVVSALWVFSHGVWAGSYQSSVGMPTIYSKGYPYTAQFSVPAHAPTNKKIKSVAWTWNYHQWVPLNVQLCSRVSNECINVSRRRSGSHYDFRNARANDQFYFKVV